MGQDNHYIELLSELCLLTLIVAAVGPGLVMVIIGLVLLPHFVAGAAVGAGSIFVIVRAVNRLCRSS